MPDEVKPGPYPGGAPTATEIACIKAKKVFDYCFHQDVIERCFPVSERDLSSDVEGIARCTVTQTRCTELGRTDMPGKPGFCAVNLQLNVVVEFAIATHNGTQRTFTRTFALPKTVVLCAPTGTQIECDVNAVCTCALETQAGPCGTRTEISCSLQVWLVVTTFAEVAMLVPSYGLCTPAAVTEGPLYGQALPDELLPPTQPASRAKAKA
jgi:hypothetical protein